MLGTAVLSVTAENSVGTWKLGISKKICFSAVIIKLSNLQRETYRHNNNSVLWWRMDFPNGSDSKVSACTAGDPGSIPGLGKSPGEGNGNPLQYPCLKNPMDGGAWEATVHGVTKSWTRLSDFTFTFTLVKAIPFILSSSVVSDNSDVSDLPLSVIFRENLLYIRHH